MPTEFKAGLDYARQLDRGDDLARWRDQFVIHDPGLIYLDGNSLGRLAERSANRMQSVVTQAWGKDLIESWNTDWYQAPRRIGSKIAQLIGAGPDDVIVSDSTSVNLFKLALAALKARPGRSRIVSDVMNFPSDLYILQGCINLLGEHHHLDLVPTDDGVHVDPQTLYELLDERTALVTLSHVTFKSGYLYDMAAVTQRAHQVGALVLWDLSHSAGVVPIELAQWEVDLAVGCTYKYLNGGPGAPAFLYLRPDLQSELNSPIWGWFGQDSPFDFDLDYRPAPGAARFLAGTPPILSLLAMEAALEIPLAAGIDPIRAKSIHLTEYLIYLVDTILTPLGFTLGSPRAPGQRGSHVSLRHPAGYQINRALIAEMKVVPDFREPDNIRLGLAPLYTSFEDVWQGVERIRQVVAKEIYRRYPAERLPVT